MEQKEKKLFMIGMSILLVLVLLIGGTYAWLTLSLKGTKVNVLKAGTLSLILNDENSIGINQEKAVPMLDEVGETLDPYHFTLENHGDQASEYTIFLDDMDLEEGEARILDNKIKYSLVKDGEKKTALLSTIGENPNRVLDTGKINGGQTITYDLRLWIDEDAGNEVMGQVLRTKIRVVAVQTDELLNDAPSECFVFDNITGTITDYLCVEGNTSDLPVLTEFAIPSVIDGVEVRHIGSDAFEENGIVKVTIPDEIQTIGHDAFQGNQLTSVIIPDDIESLGSYAFYNNQLTSVNIPSNITSLEADVFAKNKLTSIEIPSNIKSIKTNAFSNNELNEVTILEGVTSIESYAFYNNQLTSVYIPTSVTSIGYASFNNNQLPNDQAFIYKRNSDGSIDTTTIVSYGGSNRNLVVIPSGITTIGEYAFSSNKIMKVTIPNTVTTIGTSSFTSNQLSSVIIPSSVTSIGSNAFSKTTTSNPSLTTIDNRTGKSFDWKSITGGSSTATFVSGTVPHTKGDITVTSPVNGNIVAVYQYNASSCVTGEESGCVNIGPQSTYTSGTIIKYKVNASEEKYFHVMFDEGDTLVMQQRENTLNSVKWYDSGAGTNDNTKGPLTVLSALESATSGWTNVKNQTYTMGSTIFKTNAFTGCTSDNTGVICAANKYTLEERTGKARMITVQEAVGLGCTTSFKSCPNWINNYLYDSTSYGGTMNQTGGEYGNNYGYWTMSAYSSLTTLAFSMSYGGYVHHSNTTYTNYGARAVVVIDK